MRPLPETVKLSVIATVGVFVWLISGFLVPSGPALEVPSSISEKNNNAETVKVVSKEIFPKILMKFFLSAVIPRLKEV